MQIEKAEGLERERHPYPTFLPSRELLPEGNGNYALIRFSLSHLDSKAEYASLNAALITRAYKRELKPGLQSIIILRPCCYI